MFDWLFFIMIMNRLHCQGRKLKREVEQALDFSPSSSPFGNFVLLGRKILSPTKKLKNG